MTWLRHGVGQALASCESQVGFWSALEGAVCVPGLSSVIRCSCPAPMVPTASLWIGNPQLVAEGAVAGIAAQEGVMQVKGALLSNALEDVNNALSR